MSIATLRNITIVLAIAAVVAFVPGAGSGAGVLISAVSLAFLAAIGWVAAIMYREHRTELYSLEDGRRAALYVALGVLAVTLTATPQLWATSAGSVAWLLLVGAGVYVSCAVLWAARRY
jgi:ABC-type phosphonate transport system ATPase subunit